MLKYLVLFENFTEPRTTVKETVIKYEVIFELADGSSDPIEKDEFSTIEEAEQEYKNFVYSDDKYRTSTHYKILSKLTYNVEYSYDPEWETPEDIDDKDKSWECIDSDVIKSESYKINESSDTLLSDIEQWFVETYDSTGSKYHLITFENTDGETKKLQVRFSDHTENINNIDRFGRPNYHISVVIANHDVTKKKFWSNAYERLKNEYELTYDADTDIEEIKSDLSDLIDEIKSS